MTLDWLKKGIVEYIGTHENVDRIEIVNYTKQPYDMVLRAIDELKMKGIIYEDRRGAYRVSDLKRALLK